MPSLFNARDAGNYERLMGRWSRRLAPVFIDHAGIADGEDVLEVGCGTGSLTFALPAAANIASLTAIDHSEIYLAAAQAKNRDPRIAIEHGDGARLRFADARFDRAVSMLVREMDAIIDKGYVIIGSPDEVAAQLHQVATDLNVGHLMLLLQFGSMCKHLAKYNTQLFAEKVMPQLGRRLRRMGGPVVATANAGRSAGPIVAVAAGRLTGRGAGDFGVVIAPHFATCTFLVLFACALIAKPSSMRPDWAANTTYLTSVM